MIIKFDDILDVYENYIYKGCKNKKKLYLFEKYKMINIESIYDCLISNNYNIGKYNIFIIKYPKYRIVMSLNIRDKIVNHYITIYSLIPKLSKYLDSRNIATRKDMGCAYGIKLLKKYIELNKKYENFYVLKLDIKKYFYNIDHNILKNMIIDKLDDTEYNLISTIIDSTNHEYINKCINNLKCEEIKHTKRIEEVKNISYYKINKGLPIGNMTSQFFAIFYLNELDHYIVNNLKIKYMIRYMDDFVLIDKSEERLKYIIKEINNILINKYKLELNTNKSKIYNIKDGFDFLGYKFKVVNKKTIVTISPKTLKMVKKKVKLATVNFNNDNLKVIYSSINNYYYGFKYGNSLVLKRYINRNFYK